MKPPPTYTPAELAAACFGQCPRVNRLWTTGPHPQMTAEEWPVCSVCFANLLHGRTCRKHPTAPIISGDI